MFVALVFLLFFFFNDTATTEIYTLSLHDALPISRAGRCRAARPATAAPGSHRRSEEHTSELQSPKDLVCRLLLEKKKRSIRTCMGWTRKTCAMTTSQERGRM